MSPRAAMRAGGGPGGLLPSPWLAATSGSFAKAEHLVVTNVTAVLKHTKASPSAVLPAGTITATDILTARPMLTPDLCADRLHLRCL